LRLLSPAVCPSPYRRYLLLSGAYIDVPSPIANLWSLLDALYCACHRIERIIRHHLRFLHCNLPPQDPVVQTAAPGASEVNWAPPLLQAKKKVISDWLGLVEEALGRCKLQTNAAKGSIRATTQIPD